MFRKYASFVAAIDLGDGNEPSLSLNAIHMDQYEPSAPFTSHVCRTKSKVGSFSQTCQSLLLLLQNVCLFFEMTKRKLLACYLLEKRHTFSA